MKKNYQNRKKSEELNKFIIQLQANIRGYLVRQEIKNKIKLCSRQELYAIKIQVSYYIFQIVFVHFDNLIKFFVLEMVAMYFIPKTMVNFIEKS